jgi:hypothetical protein
MDHRGTAEQLLQQSPVFNPITFESPAPFLAIGHALLALIEKLDEIPMIAMHLKPDEDEEEEDE